MIVYLFKKFIMKKSILFVVLLNLLFSLGANFSVYADLQNNYEEIIEKAENVKNKASYLKKNSNYDTVWAYSVINKTKKYSKNLEVWAFFEAKDSSLIVDWDLILWSSSKIDKDLIVYWNLKAWAFLEVKWNIIVTWDIELSSSTDINWYISWKNIISGSFLKTNSIKSDWNVILWSSSKIFNWVSSNWYFTSWSFTKIEWKNKILGNLTLWSNSEINGLVYIYWDFKSGAFTSFDWTKIKISKNLYFWSSTSIDWRFYLYWKKYTDSFYEENLWNYTGFFGKIDPLLNYTYSESKIVRIKNVTNNYLAKVNKIQSSINWLQWQEYPDYSLINTKKTEKYNTYIAMFKYLKPFIQDENFDEQVFSNLQKKYIWTSISTSVEYKAYVPSNLKVKLNKVLDNIPEYKKEEIFNKVSSQINTIVSKLKEKEQTSKVIEKINILLWIKNIIDEKLEELEGDIFSEIGL